jgi:hypothetical protein
VGLTSPAGIEDTADDPQPGAGATRFELEPDDRA